MSLRASPVRGGRKDRIELAEVKNRFRKMLTKWSGENGYGLYQGEIDRTFGTQRLPSEP